MKPTLEEQLAELRASQRSIQRLMGGFVVAVLAGLVVGAPIAMAGGLAGGGLTSNGTAVNGADITPASITITGNGDITMGTGGDINLGSDTNSRVRGGAAYLRLDNSVGFQGFYTGSTFTLDGNAALTNTAGRFSVSGDTSSPALAGFRLVPQDAEPAGASLQGDMYVTSAGVLKICTAAGTPGTWVSVGAQ